MLNYNLIIFCGADNTGKTTISKKLSNILGWKYYKNTLEHSLFKIENHKTHFENHAPFLFDFIKQTQTKNIIFDRHNICEYVYGKCFNRNINEPLIFELDKLYAEYKTIIVFCYKDNYKEYNDEIIPLNKIKDINSFYEEYLTKTNCKYLKVNTESENLNEQLTFIINNL